MNSRVNNTLRNNIDSEGRNLKNYLYLPDDAIIYDTIFLALSTLVIQKSENQLDGMSLLIRISIFKVIFGKVKN